MDDVQHVRSCGPVCAQRGLEHAVDLIQTQAAQVDLSAEALSVQDGQERIQFRRRLIVAVREEQETTPDGLAGDPEDRF